MQTIIGKKKKGVLPCFFLAAGPSTFSSHTEKKNKKKNNVLMPGPRRVITGFFCFFFHNSKSSVFSVCQRKYVTGRHGQKRHPAVAHFAEELQNPFSNPYVDSHGSAQIPTKRRHAILGHSHFQYRVKNVKICVKIPRKCSRYMYTLAQHERNRMLVTVTSREIVAETAWREKHTFVKLQSI